MSELKDRYFKTIAPQLKETLGIKTIELIPKLIKVTINIGAGDAHSNKQMLESLHLDMSKISGAKAVSTISKKAISAFKVREGNIVGLKTTLRGDRMYDFIDKLISITIPRIRDFRGMSNKSFDGMGNYSIGFKEHTIFVEIPYETNSKPHGIQVVINTSTKNDQHSKLLLELLGFPFKKDE
jgi:large subunit ribosomal protein L5